MVRGRRDRRGWGCSSDTYTSKEGFKVFSMFPNVPSNLAIWRKLWENKTLPKIDLFSWTLVHGRILTGDNLERRGFVGPFQFPLCSEHRETIQHLFFECSYASNVWKQMKIPWLEAIQLSSKIQQCFINWEKAYNGDLDHKNGFKEWWLNLPKIICWCIWIERNLIIF